jgi:uncharacterized protein YjbJ (UPF0337 family)
MRETNKQVIGRIKLAAGALTNNDRLQGEGRVDEAKGKPKGAVEDVKQAVKRTEKK